jgi:hypothetical protein
MSTGKQIAVELMDQLLIDLFDFSFLEPIVSFDTVIKVKPAISKSKKVVAEPAYLKTLTRKEILER